VTFRVIQTFIRRCSDCPHSHYYSGGVYECGLTDEKMTLEAKDSRVGAHCPLPFAGPPVRAPRRKAKP
jgi:hypothetical protein